MWQTISSLVATRSPWWTTSQAGKRRTSPRGLSSTNRTFGTGARTSSRVSGPRRSVTEPYFDAEVNIIGTLSLLENCVRHGVKKVVFASTGGAIYGEQREFPV